MNAKRYRLAHQTADALAQSYAADVARGRAATAQLAERIGATVAQSATVGEHDRRTLAQLAADIGMHIVDLDAGGAAVARIGGMMWR